MRHFNKKSWKIKCHYCICLVSSVQCFNFICSSFFIDSSHESEKLTFIVIMFYFFQTLILSTDITNLEKNLGQETGEAIVNLNLEGFFTDLR